MSEHSRTKVAIACQGGGSHTAFTAGVLKEFLRAWGDDYELVGISGTFGGATGCVYAAAGSHATPVAQEAVGKAAGVAAPTVRARWEELEAL